MAEIVFFKSPQMKDDVFADIERELRGMFVLSGVPAEITSATMARLRRIFDLCLTRNCWKS